MTSAVAKPLPARRPSLRDVAKVAGVTPAAVSYVVNGRTDQVSADTHSRIQQAIESLRYRPQRRGLSLRLNREFAVGLVILDPDPHFLADPFTTQVAAGLSNALIGPGYSLIVTGARTLQDLQQYLSRPAGADALAVLVSGAPESREQAYRLVDGVGMPVVVIQDRLPPGISDGCAVLQNDFGGGAALARHLLGSGARTFLLVSPERDWPAIERREAGFAAVLKGKRRFDRICCDEQDYAATLQVIGARLDRGPLPDAILGGNDQIAIAVLKVLAQRGIAVPQRVKVTGFNNFVFRNYTTPVLTTVTSSAYEMGERVAGAVLSRLEAGSFAKRQVELPVSLVLGETT